MFNRICSFLILNHRSTRMSCRTVSVHVEDVAVLPAPCHLCQRAAETPRRAETHRARAANMLRFTPVSFITADMLARLSVPVCLYYCHFYSALHNNVLSSRERKSSERSCVEKCHRKSKETESGLFHANFKVSCGIRGKKGTGGQGHFLHCH